MLLTRLCRNYRRLIGWSLFLLVLAAVGVGVYAMLPPEPRWMLAEGPTEVFYAGDGRLGTFPIQHGEPSAGPLVILDAATGEEVDRFLVGPQKFPFHLHTDDGRYFIAVTSGTKAKGCRIHGVDLRERREWQVDAAVGKYKSLTFATGGQFIVFYLETPDDSEASYAVVETATG